MAPDARPGGGHLRRLTRPLAIAMWDFSWLEQHGPGGAYADWPRVLDELQERGYDAIRIDPYPHLLAADPDADWILEPAWTQERWGAQHPVRVSVRRSLVEFVSLCADRGLRVALSSWFRADRSGARLRVSKPNRLAAAWAATLARLDHEGLLASVLYVDLCNEFPLEMWAPFVQRKDVAADRAAGARPGAAWMRGAIEALRPAARSLELTFSFDAEEDPWSGDVRFLDFLELHVWMAQWSDFHERIGYRWDPFGPAGYDALASRGEATYRADPGRWAQALERAVAGAASWSRELGLRLVTTEGWGVINYRDDPRLDWGWVKELCELGIARALATGRWAALCTSNFCGPQFEGMWTDARWHQALTGRIRAGRLEAQRDPAASGADVRLDHERRAAD